MIVTLHELLRNLALIGSTKHLTYYIHDQCLANLPFSEQTKARPWDSRG